MRTVRNTHRRRVGRKSRLGIAFAVAVVAAASGNLATAKPVAESGSFAETCTAYETIDMGRTYVNNNLWGMDAGSGEQCVWDVARSGETVSWGTEWSWAGTENEVKSYASAVLGWHWGWKSQDTGLPVRLDSGSPVTSRWEFTVSENPGTMNVAYDLWLHDIAAPDWEDQPTDEVRVWLYRSGGAGPLGEKVDTVEIGGATWDVYEGDVGWKVHSFVRHQNTDAAEVDLTAFLAHLTERGAVRSDAYLSSVQAGAEVFTGAGRMDTEAYSVDVG